MNQKRETILYAQDITVLATGPNVSNNLPRTIERDPSGRAIIQTTLTGDTKYTSITLEVRPDEVSAILRQQLVRAETAPARRHEDIVICQRASEVGIGNKPKLAGAAQFGIRRVNEGELKGLAGMKEGSQDFPVSCATARARLGVADRHVPLVGAFLP